MWYNISCGLGIYPLSSIGLHSFFDECSVKQVCEGVKVLSYRNGRFSYSSDAFGRELRRTDTTDVFYISTILSESML